MELEKRYVTYGALRLTGGMAVSGIGVIAFIWAVWTLVNDLLTGEFNKFNITDYLVIILTFVVFGFFIWLGRYMKKKKKWPYYIIERYNNEWLFYQISYDSGSILNKCWIKPDDIIGVVSYKKKYYNKKGEWYIEMQFGITDGEKYYGLFFSGWLRDPKDINELDKFIEKLRELGERNRKKINKKIPSSVTWYGVGTYQNSEYAKNVEKEAYQLLIESYEK